VNHADIKKHLADYLEGELPIDERALVDAHLDSCDSCSGEVEEMLQTIQLLRRLPEPEQPPFVAANVMRRIRSGESQLGFFARIGRTLGAVFEPGFVLPASAIAAAALVVTVVQGVGGVSMPNFGWDAGRSGEETRRPGDRTETSAASLAPSIATASRSERSAAFRAEKGSSAPNGMDFVARVERLATGADQTRSAGRGPRASFLLTGPGTQIRIQLNGLGLANGFENQPTPLLVPLSPLTPTRPNRSTPLAGPVLASQGTDLWTTDFSGVMTQYSSGVAGPGTLVSSGREASGNRLTRPVAWPEQSIADRGFLTGGGNSTINAEGRDPRDAWLALAFEDPIEFARYIAGRNLAEQELWAARLSERAEMRGLLDEFLRTLRDSDDPTAAWVADDFSAQAELAHSFDSVED
jgi:hypothetical protein